MQTLSNTTDQSPTYCSMLWNHLFVDPSGRIKPCCRFTESERPANFSINNQTLSEAFHSNFFNSIRQQMKLGNQVAGCRRCYEEENSSKISLRERYNKRSSFTQGIDLEKPKIEWLEMSTSNLCNLACRMCDSRYSSLWFDQEKRLYGKTNSKTKVVTHELDDFSIPYENIKHLKFTGGEPLLDPLHIKFLKKIVMNSNSKKISLNYSTNCIIMPSSELIELWKKFEFVEIALSIDSFIPKELEYIRWPAKYENVFEIANCFLKLRESMSIQVGLRPTISILNISNLDQLYLWWDQKNGGEWFNPTHVTFPRWLSLTVLSPKNKNSLKVILEKKMNLVNSNLFSSHINHLINYMFSSNDQNLLSIAKENLNKVDLLRNQSFFKIYGNLFDEQ
jgi:radical SAM protein with 4Fe4S-binding SPASM domain